MATRLSVCIDTLYLQIDMVKQLESVSVTVQKLVLAVVTVCHCINSTSASQISAQCACLSLQISSLMCLCYMPASLSAIWRFLSMMETEQRQQTGQQQFELNRAGKCSLVLFGFSFELSKV